jgi:hypothetical protein
MVSPLNSGKRKRKNGEPGGTRTRDHRIKSAMLYQLSYRPVLRLRPLASFLGGDPSFAQRISL